MTDAMATQPKELHARSIMAAIAATVGMITGFPSIVAAPLGLYVIPITESFGIGRGVFGLFSALSLLACAGLTPYVGRVIDRLGVRKVVLPGVFALALIQVMLSFVSLWTPLLMVLFLLQGAAGALLTTLAYTRVISLWFHKRRGAVLAVSAAFGSGGGAGISTVMTGMLMESGGWRMAYLGSAIYMLLALPILVLFLREPSAAVQKTNASQSDSSGLVGLKPNEALKTKEFRLLLLMMFASISALTVMMSHGPALLQGRGLMIGGGYLGAAALGSILGQLISGTLLDRINSPRVGIPFALAALIGGAVILHSGFSAAIVLPAAFVMGLGQGAEVGLASYYVSRYCGLRAYAAIFGFVVAMVTVTAGVFPMFAGFVFDRTGGYDAIIPLLYLFLAMPVAIIAILPPYRFAARADQAPA